MKKIVIAIDGYSSCGKSTFAKAIAADLGYLFIDTGAMYRAVTLFAIREGIMSKNIIDEQRIVSSLPKIDISFKYNDTSKSSDLFLNGVNMEREIRSLEVSDGVSLISRIGEVRRTLVSLQQKMGEQRGIVMDGRDIGTVVFPDAELKIFMTASVEVRAKRRYNEFIAKGEDISLNEILENISLRDRLDETRDISPLKRAEDAILLDNSNMNVEQQMEWVMKIIRDIVTK